MNVMPDPALPALPLSFSPLFSKVTREEIIGGVRGRENEARKVAMYLVKRCCDRTLPEIAEYFGIGSYSAVKKSLESDYPRPKAGALRPIHGFATAISDTRPTHAFIPVHRTGHPAYSRELELPCDTSQDGQGEQAQRSD